ncbi:MAG: heavy-metal-associated domain-containing protein [Clostridia bacterium]|nr:heavy-metal-associated domain-containing protein [Clostridia bacterium]
MKKVYKLENLDCAVCAEKMKHAIEKIDGVESCDVSFLMQKLTICADETRLDEIMKKVVKACKKVEPDCKILF